MRRAPLLWAGIAALLALGAACAPAPAAAPAAAAVPRPAAAPAAGDAAGRSPPLERVEVTAVAGVDDAMKLLARLGAQIELRSYDRIQALVPPDRVPQLRDARTIVRVEAPVRLLQLQVASASELIGSDRWQRAGFSGYGVRVAILDAGFDDYRTRLGSTLPASVRTRSFRSDNDLSGRTDHGTRAAEVVHRVAPSADLYLVNFGTLTELSAAVDFLVAERVDIVSFSLGFVHNGPGDGTGPVNEIVGRGTAGGALWTVAAGNWAQQHWSGAFVDSDSDSVQEFAPGVTQLGRFYPAGDLIIVSLRWDDRWGAACSDYDLELFGPSGALVRASRQIQDCKGDPVEGLQVLATSDGVYSVRVIKASADGPRQLDLLVVGSPGRGAALDRFVTASSLAQPADHPAVIAVGAASGPPLAVEPFSSRGPTKDGRPKPEIASPTGVAGSLARGEAFAGTSAATPHVAGALALLKEAFPAAGRSQLQAQLNGRAVDLAPAGFDSASGFGMVSLGPLDGLGPLLPEGADRALIRGGYPPSEGLALLLYTGPDNFPLRFAHLFTEGRRPLTWFRFDAGAQRWDRFIVGAPSKVNNFETVINGTVLVARFAAPDE